MIPTTRIADAWHTVINPKKSRPNLPEIGRRCRLHFRECDALTDTGRMKIRHGIDFYGYLANEYFCYVPLYKVAIPSSNLEAWTYDETNPRNGKKFPLFFNGFGRDSYEAFRIFNKRGIRG